MSSPTSTATLRSLLALSEKRDLIIAELKLIDAEIGATLKGAPVAGKTKARPKVGEVKLGRRGAVKEMIVAGLREAGEAGIAVQHLAKKIGLKPQNIHTWLYTTGKKNGLVKAVGRGIYRLEEAMGATTPISELKAPKPAKVRRTARRKKS